jgi:hypothetical protein
MFTGARRADPVISPRSGPIRHVEDVRMVYRLRLRTKIAVKEPK